MRKRPFSIRITTKLSAIGETQALRLGRHWTRQKMVFNGVCSGPLVRHKQTAKIVGTVYRDADIPFPEPVVIPEFDEYQADAALKQGLPRLVESNSEVRKLHRAFQNSTNPERRLANFEKMFEMLITKWDAVLSPEHPLFSERRRNCAGRWSAVRKCRSGSQSRR
jgi:hypothetical protein